MITIISANEDVHAQAVMHELKKKGINATMLDLSNFPAKARLTMDYDPVRRTSRFHYGDSQTSQNLDNTDVIWWRRPQPYSLDERITRPEDMQFCYTECDEAFSGIWQSIDCFWINHPTREETASRKVLQLKLASELGFRIPTTCITNDPEKARRFVSRFGAENTIYKPFTGSEEAWRETRVLREDEVGLIESVRHSPVIFQEYIRADADLRITIVDRQIFAASIVTAPEAYQVDFRMAMDEVTISAAELPQDLQDRLLEFMDRLGLVYGAIDMRLTPDGEYVFLEINPTGQWLFVEEKTGQPISAALAELMIRQDSRVQEARLGATA